MSDLILSDPDGFLPLACERGDGAPHEYNTTHFFISSGRGPLSVPHFNACVSFGAGQPQAVRYKHDRPGYQVYCEELIVYHERALDRDIPVLRPLLPIVYGRRP